MNRFLDFLLEWIGRCVAWLVLGMVAAMVAVVVRRYVFQLDAIYLQEAAVYMHAVLFMVGLSYAMKHDAHVRVDLLYSRFSPRRKALVNLLGHLFFLMPMAIVIVVYSLDYVAASWRILEGSQEVGGIPAVYLLKTVIPVSAILLLLQSALETVCCIHDIRSA